MIFSGVGKAWKKYATHRKAYGLAMLSYLRVHLQPQKNMDKDGVNSVQDVIAFRKMLPKPHYFDDTAHHPNWISSLRWSWKRV